MKIVSIHDINFNKDASLKISRYTNSSIGNVQVAHKSGELGAFTIQQACRITKKNSQNQINIYVLSFKAITIMAN
jgi:hypothetical protein